jgi:F-type H+-transporting ATPase subunit delta
MSQKSSRRDIVRTVTTALIEQPADRSLWLRRLAAYLVEHKLHNQVDLIINDIARELSVQSGLVTAEVVSARKLTDSLRTSLNAFLKAETGAHTVVLSESVDPALVGGFVARTADAEIDASVQTKLRKLATVGSTT